METRYYAAMTPTPARPILTEPSFERVLSEADGLIVDNGGLQAFWPRKGRWGPPGPSAAGAILGDASSTYVSEVTRDQAEQLLAKLGPTATLP